MPGTILRTANVHGFTWTINALTGEVKSLTSLLVSQLFSYGRQIAKDHS